jgi:hypothetical protein
MFNECESLRVPVIDFSKLLLGNPLGRQLARSPDGTITDASVPRISPAAGRNAAEWDAEVNKGGGDRKSVE